MFISCLFLLQTQPTAFTFSAQFQSLSLSSSDVNTQPQLSQASCGDAIRSRPIAFSSADGKEKEEPPRFSDWIVLWAGQCFHPRTPSKRQTGGRAGWDGDEISAGAATPTRSSLMSRWKLSGSSSLVIQMLKNNVPSVHLPQLEPLCSTVATLSFPLGGERSQATADCVTAPLFVSPALAALL